jgi:protein-disulfide isomerase
MRIARNHGYVLLAAVMLAAAYFAWSMAPGAKLEFRDRAFPYGFRDLVLEGSSSRLDPSFALQQVPLAAPAPKPSLREVCRALLSDPGSPAVGERDSPTQIVAFLDYRCPYCKTLASILPKLQAGHVRLIYKEWPILGDSSVLAARAALAADKQGKYLAFHTRLMNSRFIPTLKLIEDIAGELALSAEQLRRDMNSAAVSAAIRRTSALASALGFIGTPVLVVGRTIAQGAITRPELDRLIENERRPHPKVC